MNLEEEEAPPGKGLKLRRATGLELPPPTQWVARGWVPRREITVLVGEEGIGKSLLWVLMAAHVTTGRPFPPFSLPAREPADVVVVVTEDSAAEVDARLRLAGADMDRIIFYSAEDDGSGTPVFGNGMSGDMLLLDALLEEHESKPAMLVVDAWLDTVAGSLNIRDTQQARQALHPWKTLAGRHDLAALLVTHTNRMDTASTRDLMGGTAALRQKARMVLFAARSKADHDEPVQHLWIGPDKSNVTGLVDAVRFNVAVEQVRAATDDDPGTSARLTAPTSAAMTIRNLLAEWKQAEQEADRKPTKTESARAELLDYVNAYGGTVPTKDLDAHLTALGYGKTAIEQAKHDSGTSAPGGYREPWQFTLHSQSPYPDPISQESRTTSESRNTESAA
ncbi:AAA family ATPase [Arthrobacter castelli]|uniref:AAA family ATPase n=1 Tax=Arthrobacter castelli TaxID=271431 RepID=UPI00138AF9F4|nr:AAA family ATPase [Arthrobacter castelli]